MSETQQRGSNGRFLPKTTTAIAKQINPMKPIGTSGLPRSGGRVDDEFLVELRGPRANRTYEEMRRNDPIIGGILFAIEMLIRQIEWDVEPVSEDAADLDAADFLRGCMADMSHTWVDMISEILTMLPFGWAWMEINYKRRRGIIPTVPVAADQVGEVEAQPPSSKYDDNRVGWASIELRGQSSLIRWVFDTTGQVRAMVQQAPPDYKLRILPLEKSMLFRTKRERNNPEGYSILRNAYRPWWFKRRIEEIEAIGIERDLAGLPVIGLPIELFDDTTGTPAEIAAKQKAIDDWIALARDIRRDEQEGIVKPNQFDDNGNNEYSLELLSTGGARQFDTTAVIKRKNEEIAVSVLMDWLLIGHEAVGSFALASSKTSSSVLAISAWVQSIAAEIMRQAVPQLFRMNQFPISEPPRIVPTDIEKQDIEEVANALKALADSGMEIFPDGILRGYLLSLLGLPSDPAGGEAIENNPDLGSSDPDMADESELVE